MKQKSHRQGPRRFLVGIRPQRWLVPALKFALNFIATTTVAIASLLATVYLAASVLLKANDIVTTARSLVEMQTGGKLEIDRAQFNVLTGLNLSGVRFYPPDPANPLGFVNGGPTLAEPLAAIKGINFNYDIPKIFLGKWQRIWPARRSS
jgi:hypothetical protein